MSGVNGDSSTVSLPCVNGCGFYGSASTKNMCSKCFREHEKTVSAEEIQRPGAVSADTLAAAAASSTPPTCPTVGKSAPSVVPEPLVVPAVEVAEPEVAEDDKVQTRKANPNRCFACRKKVGLLGFKCQCEYTFCSEHRYSDKHECDFDWKARGQAHISKSNPVVKADKLQRF